MLTFDLLADMQKGSGSNIGLPKRIGQMTFSSSSVAAVHWAAVMVPLGEWTAKCALSHCSGSPVVEPGSVHVPATHWALGGAVVAHPEAQVVVVVPGSQLPPPLLPLLLPPPLLPLLLLLLLDPPLLLVEPPLPVASCFPASPAPPLLAVASALPASPPPLLLVPPFPEPLLLAPLLAEFPLALLPLPLPLPALLLEPPLPVLLPEPELELEPPPPSAPPLVLPFPPLLLVLPPLPVAGVPPSSPPNPPSCWDDPHPPTAANTKAAAQTEAWTWRMNLSGENFLADGKTRCPRTSASRCESVESDDLFRPWLKNPCALSRFLTHRLTSTQGVLWRSAKIQSSAQTMVDASEEASWVRCV